jgi:small subunit ribosomal protein S6
VIKFIDVIPAMQKHGQSPGGGGEMMRNYETIFILHPSFDEEAVKTAVDKFKGVIETEGGVIDNVDLWGKRRLAYEIDKVNEGIYVLFNFQAEPELPKELDRIFRITDGVIRHIIVKLDK